MPLDSRGREIPDPTPVARPVHFDDADPLVNRIRQIIRSEVSRAAADSGAESFEDADDFDVGDDFEPSSPWELSADQEVFSAPPQAGPAGPVPPGPGAPAPAPVNGSGPVAGSQPASSGQPS